MVHVHGQQHLHGAYHDRADLAGARKEALVFALVFIITTAIAFGLKYAIARPRPNDLGVTPAAQPAFPSAHTANAFALRDHALVVSSKVQRCAICVGRTRCLQPAYLGPHYFTDLIGGALVGIAVSFVITRAEKRIDEELTDIANSPPPPTTWQGAIKLPLVFI